jgi:hypothetical protein
MTMEITEARMRALAKLDGTIGIEGETNNEEIVVRIKVGSSHWADIWYSELLYIYESNLQKRT